MKQLPFGLAVVSDCTKTQCCAGGPSMLVYQIHPLTDTMLRPTALATPKNQTQPPQKMVRSARR